MSQIVLPARDSELACLVEKACDGTITAAEGQRLEALLAHDRAAQRYYVAYMDVHVQTQWLHRGGRQAAEGRDEPSPLAGPPATPLTDVPADGVPSDAGPAPIHPQTSAWGVASWGSLAISYTMAGLLLGLGIFAAATWQSAGRAPAPGAAAKSLLKNDLLKNDLVNDARPAAASARGAPQIAARGAPQMVVGRITRLAGGDWGDQLKLGTEVRLGGRFMFTSGLVEITYTDGGRVVLTGPAIFEAAAPNGGILWLGKILAYATAGKKGTVPVFAFPGAPAGLLSIHTPLTTVSGWGESCFGVWVAPKGKDAYTRVFQGQVSFVSPHGEQAVSLEAGSCAFIGNRDDDTGTVVICRGDPSPAVARRLPNGAPLYSKDWQAGPPGAASPQDQPPRPRT